MTGYQGQREKRGSRSKIGDNQTVWEIMQESVNDNTPGFTYWIIRIGSASFFCALCLGVIRNWILL